MSWEQIRDVACAVLMLAGAAFCLLGALGLVRLPDLPARLQAATKPQTLGLLLILLGTAFRVSPESAVTLLLVVLFQVVTAPVISQIVGRSAYRSGTLDRSRLIVDDLTAQVERDERDAADRTTTTDPDRT
ncbi:multisubunit sodium/proton antiporter MrpG subunit [Pseudonocardia sediminis]|uniref:Multisubunit sodium/proton antiporter MrpG subunit n=1 Tax=Pseudonocardia sediminis TaxID=1397368 RepID=A0A4Q7USI5_PSEST|nr:monovalent cation/H(+) antiporter subunit G [Pseudonocardia sediminis]RZT84655.1 multisubunit sodium/proton antiporter MrpG subunit [Pseudonocardia sediminis]